MFQTGINFGAGTATNGSPTLENATNLFTPTLTGLTAHNDIHALSNTVPSTAPDYAHLLILSAPDGKVVKIDRAGNIHSTLPVSSIAQNEGLTMDSSGNIYVVSEIGGGPGSPEMVVYSPTTSKTAVGVRSNLYLSFNQTVSAGTGVIVLSNGTGDTRSIAVSDTAQVKISGTTVTINPSTDLFAGSPYSVTWAAGVFKDASGANAPAITGTSELAFTTAGLVDTTAPTLVSAAPAAPAWPSIWL